MKTSTLVVIGLGIAAVAYVAIAQKAAMTNPPSGTGASGGGSTRDAVERAAVEIGKDLIDEGLDWLFDRDDDDRAAIGIEI